MILKKRLLAVALASAIEPALAATEIDQLVTTSQSIRDTFDYGIRAISGMDYYSGLGGIAPVGITDPGLVTYQQADAYNDAIAAVQQATYPIDAGAQDYFNEQSQQAMNNVQVAIDTYVQAAGAMIEVTRVNELAADAQAQGDNETAAAIQDYIGANDVTLEAAEVDMYNDALVGVEGATQEAAAFMAVANDATLIDSANQQANDFGATYANAGDAFFDAASGEVTVDFAEATFTVMLAVNDYFKTNVDILTEGENQPFYTTGPTYSQCFFSQSPEEYEQCMAVAPQ